jgi:hypothetical protein
LVQNNILKCCDILVEDKHHCNVDVIFYGIEINGKLFKRKWHVKILSGIYINSMIIPTHLGILINKNFYNKIGFFSLIIKLQPMLTGSLGY